MEIGFCKIPPLSFRKVWCLHGVSVYWIRATKSKALLAITENGICARLETNPDTDGNVKGNVDADLVLQAMLDYNNFDKTIIVTSDGDFYSLVANLYENKKLKFVMSPYVKTCSNLLKKSAKEKIIFMDNLKGKIELK